MREMLYRSLARAILICALGVSGLVGYAQPGAIVSVQSQNFNPCSQPAGWTANVIVGNRNWQFNTPGFAGGSLNGTCAAVFDDDAAGPGATNHAELLSPSVNTNSYAQVTLEFDYNNEVIGGHEFRVSVWDGSSWVLVFSLTGNDPAGFFGQSSASINVSQYKNANFQVRYEYQDQGAWSWGVGVDNHEVLGQVPYQYDALVRNNMLPQEYTRIPVSQTPTDIIATAENIGTDTLTNVVVTTTIDDGITFLSQSSSPMVLAPGESFDFVYPGGFIPPNPAVWDIESQVTVAESDGNLSNNTTSTVSQEYTDTLYARDDFAADQAIGIGAGTEGSIGVEYDIQNLSAAAGIQVHLGGAGFSPPAGEAYSVALWRIDDSTGVPGQKIAESMQQIAPGGPGSGVDIIVNFNDPILLQPGRYVATIEEPAATNNIILGHASDIYDGFEDKMWVRFPGNPNQISDDWGHLHAFGPVFQFTPMVRLLMSNVCMIVEAGADTAICIDESTTLGGMPTAVLGTEPYTYSWSPGTSLDDSTIANPLATPLQTTTYTLSVTDSAGCTKEDEITIAVNPKDTATLFLPNTDYCIDDPRDTIDYQPLGGILTGPGVILVDSGSVGPGSSGGCTPGYIETVTAGGNGGNVGGMVFYTVENTSGFPINLVELGMNISAATTVEIYTIPGGHAGNETNAGAWTLVGTADATGGPFSGPFPGNGTLTPSPINGTVTIPPGVWGIALATPSASHNYTNGNGANQNFSNGDITLDLGSAANTPFGAPFVPRVWNGYLDYEVCSGGGGGDGAKYVFDPDSAGVGTHDITYCYTNQFGCEYCDTITVTVHPLPDPTIDPVLPQCLNADNLFLTAATPLGTWSGPGIVDPVAGEFDPSAAGVGLHTIVYEVLDPNGCFNSDSIQIRVWDIPTADAGMDPTICEGDDVVIGGNPTGTPGSDPLNGFIDNYSWSPQMGLNSSTDPNPVASPVTTTTYVVTVQDNNGCTDMDTVTVTVVDAPVADAGQAVYNSCNGTPVVIGGAPSASQGTPPYTYNWAPSAGLSSSSVANPTASPAVNTVYTLTVTDANGCEDEATVEVRIVSGPVANAGADVAVCSEVDVTLGGLPTAAGGTPPYSYSWSPASALNDPTLANPIFNASNFTALPVPYSFTVTVTDQNGCESTDVVNITLNPAVIVDAGADREICWGDGTQLGGIATATNGVPPYQYNWGPTVGVITPNVSNPNATPTSNTIYTVQVTDDNGCVGEDQVTVIVNPLPIAEAGPDQTICKGTTTQIGGLPTANGGLAPYKYSWSPYIGLNDDSTANPIAGPSVTETFTLTVVDAKGCIDKDVTTVFVVEGPTAAAGVDKDVCIGEGVQIGAKPAASGGQAPYNYKWSPSGSLDNDTHENPVASPQQTTMYYLTVYDANNCEDRDSMVVTVNPLPEPAITNIDDHYCVDDQIITLNGDPSGGIFVGNGVSGSTFNPGHAGPGQHEITYIYTDQNGCTASVSYVVEVHRRPIIYAGPDKTVYLGYSTTLDAEAGGVYTYVWSPTTYLDDPNALNPNVVLPLETTTYTITATDMFGCENSDEVTVFVDVNTPLNPPNTFTPNGDGINDTWEIPLLDFFASNNVKIYNRWGQLVFEADNYSSGNAWDGDDLPEGTYFYVITLQAQGNNVHRGTVTIVR